MKPLARWLLLLILLPLWGGGLILDRMAERVLLEDVHERLVVALHAHQQHLLAILAHQQRNLRLYAAEAVGPLAEGKPPRMDRVDLATYLPEIIGCSLFDAQRRLVAHTEVPGPSLAEMAAEVPAELAGARITDPTREPSGGSIYNVYLPLTVSRPRSAFSGTMACRLKNILSQRLTEHRQGLKLTGEVYLVSAKTKLLLTESRFVPNAVGRVTVDTLGVREALKRKNGITLYPDYRGVPVIGTFLYLPDYDWVLLAEMDEAEALDPLIHLRIALAVSLGLVSIAAGFVGWRYGRRLTDAFAQVEEAEAQLWTLLNVAHDAVFESDATSTILMANKSAHRMFGWPAGALIGQNVTVLMSPAERPRYQAGLRRYLETGESSLIGKTVEVTGSRRDGTLVSGELSLAAMTLPDGTRRFVGILRDITERTAMETQARRLERLAALGQLLGGIAHEIKNPLFVLTGRLQLLREKLAQREYGAIEADMEKIEADGQRMATIVQRFLRLSRPYEPKWVRCSVEAVLQETLAFLANELLAHHIRVVTSLAPNLPSVWADPQHLQEVFRNLIVNAQHAMETAHEKGTLMVTAALVRDTAEGERHGEGAPTSGAEKGRQGETEIAASPGPAITAGDSVRASVAEGDWIEVRIQDDGPGIRPEHRPRLFEPFFTTKPPEQGTGLGLWTVRTVLMALKGSIAYETEVGQGTTFIVRLPAAKELNH